MPIAEKICLFKIVGDPKPLNKESNLTARDYGPDDVDADESLLK